ncbi:MAG: mannose-6-phosphate isomerase [Sphingomonadales bacterium 32-68-7]|nr:MAG: mannose-6-phosphate isomerase [Sphingomonadales bacterium 32-68-7]
MLLPTRTVEKPWGMDRLPAPFATPEGKRIGEIWFEPPPEMPQLLVKYLFTSEKLSVQVHPSDTQTEAAGLGRQGKEECWLVIDAEPGATLGIGFKQPLDAEAMRAAALDGSIEDLLTWHPVRAGDFFYIPANTVHELHLEESVAVAKGEPYDVAFRKRVPPGDVSLVDGPYFVLDQVEGLPSAEQAARYDGALLVMPREGAATIDGEAVKPGECALAASLAGVAFDPAGSCLIARPLAGAR